VEPLALPIRARFVPLRGRPDCSPGWCIPRIPGGRFSAVLLAMDGGLVLFVPAAGGRLPHWPAPSHRGCHGGGDRVRVAHRRVEDWHGAVVSDAIGVSGRCASGGVMPQGFPGIPSQGLDLVEPVTYLSWTGDVPVMHPLYTCAGNAPDHEAARSACGGCKRGARTAEVDLA
jgi:hypothetical protein